MLEIVETYLLNEGAWLHKTTLEWASPFQDGLAYCLCDRYAKSNFEDGGADLDFRDLLFKVPHYELLVQ